MDPVQFIWEVIQAVAGLVAAVVIPVGGLWLIARRQKRRRLGSDRPTTE